MATELQELQEDVLKCRDYCQIQRRRILRFLPQLLHAPLESCLGFLGSDLGIQSRELGICAFPFGAATVIALRSENSNMEVDIVGGAGSSTQVRPR